MDTSVQVTWVNKVNPTYDQILVFAQMKFQVHLSPNLIFYCNLSI